MSFVQREFSSVLETKVTKIGIRLIYTYIGVKM